MQIASASAIRPALLLALATALAAAAGWTWGQREPHTAATRAGGMAAADTRLRQAGFLVYETDHPRIVQIGGRPQPQLVPPVADVDVWDPTLISAPFDTTGAPLRAQRYPTAAAALSAQHAFAITRTPGYYTRTTRRGRMLVVGTVYTRAMTARLSERLRIALHALAG